MSRHSRTFETELVNTVPKSKSGLELWDLGKFRQHVSQLENIIIIIMREMTSPHYEGELTILTLLCLQLMWWGNCLKVLPKWQRISSHHLDGLYVPLSIEGEIHSAANLSCWCRVGSTIQEQWAICNRRSRAPPKTDLRRFRSNALFSFRASVSNTQVGNSKPFNFQPESGINWKRINYNICLGLTNNVIGPNALVLGPNISEASTRCRVFDNHCIDTNYRPVSSQILLE